MILNDDKNGKEYTFLVIYWWKKIIEGSLII